MDCADPHFLSSGAYSLCGRISNPHHNAGASRFIRIAVVPVRQAAMRPSRLVTPLNHPYPLRQRLRAFRKKRFFSRGAKEASSSSVSRVKSKDKTRSKSIKVDWSPQGVFPPIRRRFPAHAPISLFSHSRKSPRTMWRP